MNEQVPLHSLMEELLQFESMPVLPPPPDDPSVWYHVDGFKEWNKELLVDSRESDYVAERAKYYFQVLEATELPNAIERDNIKYYPDDPMQMNPFMGF